ncbi:Thymidylate synthase [candidate division SR1 bacterium RAAC1_SR1_1]|nr:Thymidylate synthase [candidate division SR1 bacterium RAAC1_SR1_1]
MPKLFYKTITQQSTYEIPKIKGSRFFATLFPIESKEQAEEYLVQIKKQYHDATHNCSAYKVGVNLHYDLFGTAIIDPAYKKVNDDGEPANTAGKPILSVLDGAGLQNILCVVTRYFGGTLLGVGGLIQSYSHTAKESLSHSQLVDKEITSQVSLAYDYDQVSLVQHLFSKYDAKVISDSYDQNIKQIVEINIGFINDFKKELSEKSNGKINIK